METLILIPNDYLAMRAGELSLLIQQNQHSDPEKKDAVKTQENLISFGKIEMINEIIDNCKAITKK